MGVTCAPECAKWAETFDDCVCTNKVHLILGRISRYRDTRSTSVDNVAETLLHMQDLVSFTLGILSVVFFANCFLPQIILNLVNGSSEGLSVGMIWVWSLGDLCNIIGVLYTGAVSMRAESC